jgi:hypothetical protein
MQLLNTKIQAIEGFLEQKPSFLLDQQIDRQQ